MLCIRYQVEAVNNAGMRVDDIHDDIHDKGGYLANYTV